jgi:hypothetical protein
MAAATFLTADFPWPPPEAVVPTSDPAPAAARRPDVGRLRRENRGSRVRVAATVRRRRRRLGAQPAWPLFAVGVTEAAERLGPGVVAEVRPWGQFLCGRPLPIRGSEEPPLRMPHLIPTRRAPSKSQTATPRGCDELSRVPFTGSRPTAAARPRAAAAAATITPFCLPNDVDLSL